MGGTNTVLSGNKIHIEIMIKEGHEVATNEDVMVL